MYCEYCGSEIKGNAKFCTNCGAHIEGQTKSSGSSFSNSEKVYEYDTNTKSDGNDALAVVAYFTWIGWLIAFLLSKDSDNELVKFHLNQSLVLLIFGLLSMIPKIGWIINIVVFIFFVIGVINAAKKECNPLPIIGDINILK